ncbi:MAG TPA: heme-binding protein [Ktedonobacteraceae bacterium]
MSLTIDLARRILEASKRRAHELKSPVSIAIVDAGGHLVLFERMMAPYGWATGNISIAKATTAVMFNQSTDEVARWGAQIPGFASSMATMSEGKFIMAAGGWPIRLNGATIGGIGVSGGNASGRDDDIARAGLVVLEPARYAPQPQPAYVPGRPVGPALQPAFTPAPLTVAPDRVPVGTVHLDVPGEGNHQEDPYGDGPAESEQYSENSGGRS